MFRRVYPVIKNQLTVITIDIIEEELLIAHGGAIFHVQNEVITLAFEFGHHVTCAINFNDAGLAEKNGFRRARTGLGKECSVVA